jgi:hypothetical protein
MNILKIILYLLLTIFFAYFLSLSILFFLKDKLKYSFVSDSNSLSENFKNKSTKSRELASTLGKKSTELNQFNYIDATLEETRNEDNDFLLTPDAVGMDKKKPKKVHLTKRKLYNPYITPPLDKSLNNAFVLPNDEHLKHPDEHSPDIAHSLANPLNKKHKSHQSAPMVEGLDYTDDGTASCQMRHEHKQCSYGVTNYIDPCDLSPIDRAIFKANYPLRMTLQDYVNWLWLYYDTPQELSFDHLRNLKKLIIGERLKYEPGVLPPPSKTSPPLNSQKYFEKMYAINNMRQLNTILRDDTDGLMGYNYSQFADLYQSFNQLGKTSDIVPELESDNIAIQKNPQLIDDLIRPMLVPKKPQLDTYSTQKYTGYKPQNHVLSVNITGGP